MTEFQISGNDRQTLQWARWAADNPDGLTVEALRAARERLTRSLSGLRSGRRTRAAANGIANAKTATWDRIEKINRALRT